MLKAIWWTSVLATFASFGGLLMLIGLHQYHYSFDPYSWFQIGGDAVLTRDLWNAQKDLYNYLILRVFILTIIFGAIAFILNFIKYKSKVKLF